MRIGNIVILLLGAVGVLLGGLWLVQGLGLVTIAPILCVADCEPLEGPAPLWAVIGAVVLAAGAYAVYRTIKRWNRPRT
jgi:hypothetical protein